MDVTTAVYLEDELQNQGFISSECGSFCVLSPKKSYMYMLDFEFNYSYCIELIYWDAEIWYFGYFRFLHSTYTRT